MFFFIFLGIVIYFFVRANIAPPSQDEENVTGYYFKSKAIDGNKASCPPHQWEQVQKFLDTKVRPVSSEEEFEKLTTFFKDQGLLHSLACTKCGLLSGLSLVKDK